MAEKGFGVKEINLIGASGTPTIESPNNLNLNAINVAISTNVSIGGTLSVTGNVSVGGTLTYEDVTNIDSVGIITARSGVDVDDFISVGSNIHLGNAGVVTATSFIGNGSGLTGVTASGTGILVKDSGSTVGTAGTINFGNNLSVGTLSAGAVTVNATSADPANSDVQVAYTVSGSGVYNFTGNGVDSSTNHPELYMYRDTKYRFIHNAGNSHPIAIFTAQSGGSKYTDGVTYSDTSNNYTTHGNNLDFTPQHDAPDTLWYRCTVHSSMVGKINIVGFDGGSTTRGVVSGTTGSLAQNAIGNISVTGHKSYLLMNVGLSTAGWFRLYTDSASRTADATRSVGEDPAAGSGVIAEVVTTGLSTSIKISPFVAGGNMDSTPSTTMYCAVKNLSSTTQAITANLTILKLED
tara:strand:+ start:374 stop:1597 length:1224 start_codon:yes stop_codon:yes gene_type:complete